MADEVATVATPNTITTTTTVKPGWKTSEFWLSLAVAVGGGLLAALNPNSEAAKIIGGIMTMMATLGYTAGRSWVKGQNAQ